MRRVAVIIPCFKEAKDRVQRTVDSALAVPNVDLVIVVDDGGDCGFVPVGLRPDRRLEGMSLSRNLGPAGALNAGIRMLTEDAVICRLDVGDVFYPEAKAAQIETVLSGEFLCSSSPHFDPVAARVWMPPADWERHIYRDSVFTGCTNVYRKEVWKEVGGHDESLRYLADWDFSMKVQHAIGWDLFPEATCEAGMHPGGYSDRAQRSAATKMQRVEDHARVARRGRRLSHPDAFRHLSDPRWLAKRGLSCE